MSGILIGDLAFAKMFEDGNTIALNPEPILLRDNIAYIFQDLVTGELRENDSISMGLDMSAVPNQVVADKSLLRVLYHLRGMLSYTVLIARLSKLELLISTLRGSFTKEGDT